jgi:hypothetical protein
MLTPANRVSAMRFGKHQDLQPQKTLPSIVNAHSSTPTFWPARSCADCPGHQAVAPQPRSHQSGTAERTPSQCTRYGSIEETCGGVASWSTALCSTWPGRVTGRGRMIERERQHHATRSCMNADVGRTQKQRAKGLRGCAGDGRRNPAMDSLPQWQWPLLARVLYEYIAVVRSSRALAATAERGTERRIGEARRPDVDGPKLGRGLVLGRLDLCLRPCSVQGHQSGEEGQDGGWTSWLFSLAVPVSQQLAVREQNDSHL